MDKGYGYEGSIKQVTEDLKKLKTPSQTFLEIIPNLKKQFTNLYTKAKNDIKRL